MLEQLTLVSYSFVKMVQFSGSKNNMQAFRTQSSQLISFAAIAVAYGIRTKWMPTQNISYNTRKELAELSSALNIEQTAHQTFIAHVRRMMIKFCADSSDDISFKKVKFANTEQDAVAALLELMESKNIFTAAHMRIWAQKDGLEPVDLTRKTGDSSKFKSKNHENFFES